MAAARGGAGLARGRDAPRARPTGGRAHDQRRPRRQRRHVRAVIWVLFLRFIVPVLGVVLRHVADRRRSRGQDDHLPVHAADPARSDRARQVPRVSGLRTSVVLPSVALVFCSWCRSAEMGDARSAALVSDLGILALGLAAYGAVFLWPGWRSSGRSWPASSSSFGWEPMALVAAGLPAATSPLPTTCRPRRQATLAEPCCRCISRRSGVFLAMRTIERRGIRAGAIADTDCRPSTSRELLRRRGRRYLDPARTEPSPDTHDEAHTRVSSSRRPACWSRGSQRASSRGRWACRRSRPSARTSRLSWRTCPGTARPGRLRRRAAGDELARSATGFRAIPARQLVQRQTASRRAPGSTSTRTSTGCSWPRSAPVTPAARIDRAAAHCARPFRRSRDRRTRCASRAPQVEQYRGKRLVFHQGRHARRGAGVRRTRARAVRRRATAVRGAIDAKAGAAADITAQPASSWTLVGDVDDGTAWSVAKFDSLSGTHAVSAGRRHPAAADQLAGRQRSRRRRRSTAWCAPKRATSSRAQNLRDVVQGFLALAKMQGSREPGLQGHARLRCELGGDGKIGVAVVRCDARGARPPRIGGAGRRPPRAAATAPSATSSAGRSNGGCKSDCMPVAGSSSSTAR